MAKLSFTIKLEAPLPFYRLDGNGVAIPANDNLMQGDSLTIEKYAELSPHPLYNSVDVLLTSAFSTSLQQEVLIAPAEDLDVSVLEKMQFKASISQPRPHFLTTPQDPKAAYTGKEFWVPRGDIFISRYGRVLSWGGRNWEFAQVSVAGSAKTVLVLVEDLPISERQKIVRFG